jgi:hypothetical protein
MAAAGLYAIPFGDLSNAGLRQSRENVATLEALRRVRKDQERRREASSGEYSHDRRRDNSQAQCLRL